MNRHIFNELLDYKPFDEVEKTDLNTMIDFVKNNEDVLTRNNTIAHFTASAWILNKDKTKVLMIYHNIYNSWAWIGGHADGEEDLKKVVLREIEEETGVKNVRFLSDDVYAVNVIPVDNHMKRGKFVGTHLHLDVAYLFEADECENLKIKDDENSGVKWIPIECIREYVSEEKMIPIYERLCKKLDIKNYYREGKKWELKKIAN